MAEAAEDHGDLGGAAVAAEAGAAVAAEAADYGLAFRGVAEGEGDGAVGLVDFEAGDVTELLHDAGYVGLHPGDGHRDLFEAGLLGVADAGEHVRDGVCHTHVATPTSWPW